MPQFLVGSLGESFIFSKQMVLLDMGDFRILDIGVGLGEGVDRRGGVKAMTNVILIHLKQPIHPSGLTDLN